MNEMPLILHPLTPSLLPGLYIHTFGPLKVGMIATFLAPEVAKHHKASTGVDVHDDSLLMKPIVPGPGDHTCRRPLERVDVNSGTNARIVIENEIDRLQPPLRQICRSRAKDEFFMMSMSLPSSFDSRHFGPIRQSRILGLYRSLAALVTACTSPDKTVLVTDLLGGRNRADAPGRGRRMTLPPIHTNQAFFNQGRPRR